ncbi:MAG: putative toxin-antitoxin system toxin component, PIN family [Bacteroidales bacterium]|nr:putative toxin-antitoxin system toxin component, PIN family [Bacteroidales bacterium]MBQ2352530.1 putative toxin-antitoxin system toxin component, PIN family [Bacteroidales bacterium]MBQ2572724.1 putative toxin-antitoxin system toxin component, PIN family [Bacteroidales bacterium]MBR3947237.1 putative toxin-antitoxin system toxin component, PIN family [Bacteroidales bacterium]
MENNNIYAVIDTNVIVSALISSNDKSNPTVIVRAVLRGEIKPVYNDEILSEYTEVLSRDKFHIQKSDIDLVISHIIKIGLKVERKEAVGEIFPDPKDVVFYEVALSKEDSYLVTGNIKHFPKVDFVVTPAEMLAIINENELK